jgi:hypothetical protein
MKNGQRNTLHSTSRKNKKCITTFWIFGSVKGVPIVLSPSWASNSVVQRREKLLQVNSIVSTLRNSARLCMCLHDSVWVGVTPPESVWLPWPRITLHDFAWLCMTLCDFMWLCMTLHDSRWLCVTFCDFAWLSVNLRDSAWLCVTLCDSAWLCVYYALWSEELGPSIQPRCRA